MAVVLDQSQLGNVANQEYTWGDNGVGNNRSQVGQVFKAGKNQLFAQGRMWLARNGVVADSVQGELYAVTFGAGVFTIGALMATSLNTITGSSLPNHSPGNCAEQIFAFSPRTIAKDQYYMLSVKRTGALGADDYVTGGGGATDTYANGARAVKTGNTLVWSTPAPSLDDLTFQTYYTPGGGAFILRMI